MKLREIQKADFPHLLKQIPQQPKSLYIEGEMPSDEMKFLCVVGSRKFTPYGKEVCEKLISGLRGYPIVIVSGLAMGIDAIAHKAALDTNLTTIAFPGSGLDRSVLYPRTNHKLADQIVEAGGALISEFEPKFVSTLWSFPQRNRIMAGMSHATLIIEAEKKSGTMITTRLATEYNRDVCAVPGSIFSKKSEGPHLLLRLGAIPVTKSEDLLEVLGFNVSETTTQQNLFENCTEDEKLIIKILETPQTRDEIIRQSKKPASEVNTILMMMELNGLIKESSGEIRLNV